MSHDARRAPGGGSKEREGAAAGAAAGGGGAAGAAAGPVPPRQLPLPPEVAALLEIDPNDHEAYAAAVLNYQAEVEKHSANLAAHGIHYMPPELFCERALVIVTVYNHILKNLDPDAQEQNRKTIAAIRENLAKIEKIIEVNLWSNNAVVDIIDRFKKRLSLDKPAYQEAIQTFKKIVGRQATNLAYGGLDENAFLQEVSAYFNGIFSRLDLPEELQTQFEQACREIAELRVTLGSASGDRKRGFLSPVFRRWVPLVGIRTFPGADGHTRKICMPFTKGQVVLDAGSSWVTKAESQMQRPTRRGVAGTIKVVRGGHRYESDSGIERPVALAAGSRGYKIAYQIQRIARDIYALVKTKAKDMDSNMDFFKEQIIGSLKQLSRLLKKLESEGGTPAVPFHSAHFTGDVANGVVLFFNQFQEGHLGAAPSAETQAMIAYLRPFFYADTRALATTPFEYGPDGQPIDVHLESTHVEPTVAAAFQFFQKGQLIHVPGSGKYTMDEMQNIEELLHDLASGGDPLGGMLTGSKNIVKFFDCFQQNQRPGNADQVPYDKPFTATRATSRPRESGAANLCVLRETVGTTAEERRREKRVVTRQQVMRADYFMTRICPSAGVTLFDANTQASVNGRIREPGTQALREHEAGIAKVIGAINASPAPAAEPALPARMRRAAHAGGGGGGAAPAAEPRRHMRPIALDHRDLARHAEHLHNITVAVMKEMLEDGGTVDRVQSMRNLLGDLNGKRKAAQLGAVGGYKTPEVLLVLRHLPGGLHACRNVQRRTLDLNTAFMMGSDTISRLEPGHKKPDIKFKDLPEAQPDRLEAIRTDLRILSMEGHRLSKLLSGLDEIGIHAEFKSLVDAMSLDGKRDVFENAEPDLSLELRMYRLWQNIQDFQDAHGIDISVTAPIRGFFQLIDPNPTTVAVLEANLGQLEELSQQYPDFGCADFIRFLKTMRDHIRSASEADAARRPAATREERTFLDALRRGIDQRKKEERIKAMIAGHGRLCSINFPDSESLFTVFQSVHNELIDLIHTYPALPGQSGKSSLFGYAMSRRRSYYDETDKQYAERMRVIDRMAELLSDINDSVLVLPGTYYYSVGWLDDLIREAEAIAQETGQPIDETVVQRALKQFRSAEDRFKWLISLNRCLRNYGRIYGKQVRADVSKRIHYDSGGAGSEYVLTMGERSPFPVTQTEPRPASAAAAADVDAAALLARVVAQMGLQPAAGQHPQTLHPHAVLRGPDVAPAASGDSMMTPADRATIARLEEQNAEEERQRQQQGRGFNPGRGWY